MSTDKTKEVPTSQMATSNALVTDRAPGTTFKLSNMLSKGALESGQDKISEVYFRTAPKDTWEIFGDIYCLYLPNDRRSVFLINADECKRKGKVTWKKFPAEKLEKMSLTVYNVFACGLVQTLAITKIVPVSQSQHEALSGKTNSLVHEFNRRMPEDWREVIQAKESQDRPLLRK
jgi:hypothetical protein